MSKTKPTRTDVSRHPGVFVRVWAGFGLLLFASTWKLWTPQTVFPQIPFFEVLVDVPGWVDWTALICVGLSLAISLFLNSRPALWLFALAASVLILLNQHRLQPWAYQFVVFAVIMAAAKPKGALFWMRWIVISIYVYSAISKFDYQFVHTVGDQMIQTIARMIGLNSSDWPAEFQNGIALCFPLFELAVGIGLTWKRTRSVAVIAAIGMHVTLVLVLVLQGHSPGVLVWNLFFIAQAVLLFRRAAFEPGLNQDEGATTRTTSGLPLSFVASVIAMFVLIFPLTQPLGISDHWVAWQVYAPCTSRAKCPGDYVRANPDNRIRQHWHDPAAWSQSALFVPVYPQARFQFAVVQALQEKYGLESMSIEIASESDRLTGKRESIRLWGDQIKMHASRYRLNLKPRSIWLDD